MDADTEVLDTCVCIGAHWVRVLSEFESVSVKLFADDVKLYTVISNEYM